MSTELPFTYHPQRAELSYEVSFSSPAFELPSKNVQLLRALHEAISPRYPINIANIQVAAGNTLGDVRISGLFLSNNAFIDIDIRRVHVVFLNIQSHDERITARDCINLVEDAWKSTFPSIEFHERSFDFRFHALIDGGRESVVSLIEGLVKSKSPIDINETDRTTGFVTNYMHKEEKWHVTLMLDVSQLIRDGLFIQLRAIYACDGEFKSFEAQEAHLAGVFQKAFRGLNLQAASD